MSIANTASATAYTQASSEVSDISDDGDDDDGNTVDDQTIIEISPEPSNGSY